GYQNPEDEPISRIGDRQENPIKVGCDDQAYCYNRINENLIFFKNQTEKNILVKFFMIEGEPEFTSLPLRGKMHKVAMCGDSNFQGWFYEKGITRELPDEWESFKTEVKNYCLGQNLSDLKRYYNEKWSNYVLRLQDWVDYRSIDQKEVLKKLRNEKAPRDLMLIFLTTNDNISEIVERIICWERYTKRTFSYDKTTNLNAGENKKAIRSNYKRDKSDIKCFRCFKKGHFANECTIKKDDQAINNIFEDTLDIDKREITLNGHKMTAIFDTGAAKNFIGFKTCDYLFDDELEKSKCYEKFTSADGRELKVTHKVNLNV
ncbi:hypothetical protein EDEG_04219, partial [Edhazardia aedis USNM 41457]